MTVFSYLRNPLLLAFALGLWACSGAGDFAGGGKSDSSSKKSDDDDDDEGEQAQDPEQVAGAFLVDCSYIDSDIGAIGCTARDKDTHKALSKEDKSYSLALYNDADDQVDMNTKDAPETSDYHVIGALPSEFRDSGYLKMTVEDKGGSGVPLSQKLPTKSINGPALGNVEPDFAGFGGLDTTVAGKVPLVGFKMTASWGDSVGLVTNAASPSDFCDTGGIVKPKLSDSATILQDAVTTGISSLFTGSQNSGSTTQSTIDKTIRPIDPVATIGADSNFCMKEFAAYIGGPTEFAQAGNGCLLILVKTSDGQKVLLIGPQQQDGKTIPPSDVEPLARIVNQRHGC